MTNAHTFNVSLAAAIGLNQAILLQHLYYWHQINEKKEHNMHDGKVWTYNTAEGFKEIFPYLTARQISYAFEKLEASGYIVTGNYNKAKFDRTKWYALTEKAIELTSGVILQNVKCKLQNVKSKLQNVRAIPDNNTDNNTNNINMDSNDVASDTSIDDKRKNLFWKGMLPKYPESRLGNRQHVLKKWMELTDAEMILAIKNAERYLEVAGPYVKQLGNYITEKCFTESWLESASAFGNKKQKDGITNQYDTKTYDNNY